MLSLARSGCVAHLRTGLGVNAQLGHAAPVLVPKLCAMNAGSERSRGPETTKVLQIHTLSTLRQRPTSSPVRLSGSSWKPEARKPCTQALTNSDKASADLHSLKEDLKEIGQNDETVSNGQKVLCEFTIQVLFNFLSCSAVAMAVKNSGGDAMVQTLQVMGAHAIILPLIIYSAMETSGAHFNPMVTACFVAVGKLPAKVGLAYVIAQLAGGVIGAAAAFASLPSSMQTLAHAGIQAVPATSSIAQAFLGEVFAAFSLVFVLFATNLDPRCNWGKLKPFSIPMVICLLMWLVGPVSSMCINPARAFGPAVVTGFWENHWIWWTAPFIGGLTAAKLYQNILLPKKFRAL